MFSLLSYGRFSVNSCNGVYIGYAKKQVCVQAAMVAACTQHSPNNGFFTGMDQMS